MKKKIIFIIILIILVIIAIFFFGPKQEQKTKSKTTPAPSVQINETDKPQIVSTKPDPLNEAIISATEIIEIEFNRPLENVGEFKSKIETKTDYKVELSGDRKTAKIIPIKPYTLGTTYTLFIGSESKFDGIGRWGEEKTFHFKTISYKGI